ncbi:A24 family peptidase [Paenibacillus endoradicis]|uniref:A24 family peptidase n=1 Tax=Paenibacillus endoradicis TaxID=2972487 RepID=UPI002158B1D0|nr:A24 family peptidase [Paenibacillus endoradicis]MCR8657859.1 A24 family peptidase [Paenibacillus endoradicis]
MESYWLAILIVIIAFYFDVTSLKIPNWICLSSLLFGYSFCMYQEGWLGGWWVTIAVLVGFIPMWLIYLFKGIGAGDVKLFASLAALIGVKPIIELMILSFLFGGVISILFIGYRTLLKINHRFRYYYSNYIVEAQSTPTLIALGIKKVHHFPFMLAVTPAMIVVYLLR